MCNVCMYIQSDKKNRNELLIFIVDKTIGRPITCQYNSFSNRLSICTLQLPIFIYERTGKYTQEATAHQVPHYLRPNNNIKVYRPTTSYYTLTTWKITLTVQVLKNPSSSKYIITIDKTFIFLKKIR